MHAAGISLQTGRWRRVVEGERRDGRQRGFDGIESWLVALIPDKLPAGAEERSKWREEFSDVLYEVGYLVDCYMLPPC